MSDRIREIAEEALVHFAPKLAEASAKDPYRGVVIGQVTRHLGAVEAAGYRILPIEVAEQLTGQMTERAIGALRGALNVPPDATMSVAYAHSSESYARGFNAGFQEAIAQAEPIRTCRECGFNDEDCFNAAELSGESCYWVADDLCSSCAVQHR